MNIGVLGNKVGMTQVFNQEGKIIPVSVIKIGPCFITEIKNKEKYGYNSVQIGYSEVIKTKKLNKAYSTYFQKKNLPIFKYLKEFRLKEEEKNYDNYKIGEQINLRQFEIGKKVKISGLTIGKGNAGNIKKHNFNRGAMTHGSKHHRLQGSMGAGTSPGRVFPGKRMPGRLGGKQRTFSGLEIIDFIEENNLLIIKGSVPGKTGNLLSISLS